jgi:hypothetical protein
MIYDRESCVDERSSLLMRLVFRKFPIGKTFVLFCVARPNLSA